MHMIFHDFPTEIWTLLPVSCWITGNLQLPELIPLAQPNLSLHWAGSEHSSQDVWRQSQHIIIAKRSKVYLKKLELSCCDASALDIGSYTAMTLMQHRRNKPPGPHPTLVCTVLSERMPKDSGSGEGAKDAKDA